MAVGVYHTGMRILRTLHTLYQQHKILFPILSIFVGILLLWAIILLVRTPSNDRLWTTDQAVLPEINFSGDLVTIANIRNATYRSTAEYEVQYYTKTFDLRKLQSVDFIIEPLAERALAHTLVSFGFTDGSHVALSVEIRKEQGETFSPYKGMLDSFELMYVIVDERDAIGLRAIHRDHPVYLYPATVPKEKIRPFFESMLRRAATLREHPEFYNTLTSTCTTNIVDHVNEITPGRVPWDLRLLMPLDADELAYELGLIDTSLPFSEIRTKYYISDLVKEHINDPDFSTVIRSRINTDSSR